MKGSVGWWWKFELHVNFWALQSTFFFKSMTERIGSFWFHCLREDSVSTFLGRETDNIWKYSFYQFSFFPPWSSYLSGNQECLTWVIRKNRKKKKKSLSAADSSILSCRTKLDKPWINQVRPLERLTKKIPFFKHGNSIFWEADRWKGKQTIV